MIKKNPKRVTGCIRKAVLAISFGICMAGAAVVPSYAEEQVGTAAGHPIFDNEFIGIEIKDGGSESASITQRGASFAVKYDPRLTGGVAKRVEDQGNYNTCWAFSTIAAIECNLIKKGYADADINLSENHLAYFFYNRMADPLGYTAGDLNLNRSNTWSQNGGTIQGTALALTTWSGVVKEVESEDDSSGAYKPKELSSQDCYKSDYRVANTYFFNYDVNTIKQAVMDYGAVVSGIYMDGDYWNLDNGAYYYPNKGGNHAVTIVGWDDDYPVANFVSGRRPQSKGAWLVKNSYGETYKGKPLGDNGYLWVSYEDASLRELAAFDMEPVSESFDNNYQYDGTANPSRAFTFESGTKYAQVFKVKGNKSGYNEILKAVSLDVLMTNVKYSIQVYTGLTSSTKPTSGKAMFSSAQTGILKNAGYNRITLKTPVTLTSGENYAIVVTLSSANGTPVPMACDATDDADWIEFVATGSSNQSYVYYKSEWFDLIDEAEANLRIKAYTDNTNQKTTYKLSSTNLGISKGSSTVLSLKTTPSSVKRKVTWTSSNKKVATISSSGKVKAKTYGTTTIKAKFAAGSKTKTLSCKVTVGPSKLSGFKAKGGKGKITVSWKRKTSASGYTIYYSKKKSSGYKKLAMITSNYQTSYSKKLSKGTYYVKMRPYLKQSGKTLYGSYTAVKSVKVK